MSPPPSALAELPNSRCCVWERSLGAPIQSRTRSQRLSAEEMLAPDTPIRQSLEITFLTRTVLPDFDGPDIEITWFGVEIAWRRTFSKSCSARSMYV